jgi:hypothetical protein
MLSITLSIMGIMLWRISELSVEATQSHEAETVQPHVKKKEQLESALNKLVEILHKNSSNTSSNLFDRSYYGQAKRCHVNGQIFVFFN